VIGPLLLGPNLQRRGYRGGDRIAAWRGDPGSTLPEDWIASTTTAFGSDQAGLTVLADGHTLREAIAADADGYLGPSHVAAFGTDPALLVKLLDAGERLPVHCHPDRDFARRRLDCAHGKTEAWVVLDAAPNSCVYLGFRRDVGADEVAGWVRGQDREELLGMLNVVPVRPGDAVFVPAGIPHAIGEGLFVAELQEPSDLSVMLEWDGYPSDRNRLIGLELDQALACLDRSAWSTSRLAELRAQDGGLLPKAADPFFRADMLHARVELEPAFAVLLVLAGEGSLSTSAGRVDLRRGHVALVPYGAGPATLDGRLDVLRCLPPRPSTVG
jgi:mannose-6-phosphate isomerase